MHRKICLGSSTLGGRRCLQIPLAYDPSRVDGPACKRKTVHHCLKKLPFQNGKGPAPHWPGILKMSVVRMRPNYLPVTNRLIFKLFLRGKKSRK